jgi:DNA-binding CsgD family transcriptional regulator
MRPAPVSSLRHHLARPDELGAIFEILNAKTDGYGPSSTDGLAPLLTRLMSEGALRVASVVSAAEGSFQLLGAAMTGFVSLEQARAWVQAPPMHLVDHLLGQEQAGVPLLLRPDEVATANGSEGQALVFVAFGLREADGATIDRLIAAMFESFRLFLAGYHCPLALHPAATARGNASITGLGFRRISSSDVFLLETSDLEDAPFNPFIALKRRPAALLGLSRAEKEMLFLALLGYSDLELAKDLAISCDTVRKRWRSVFARVAACREPQIFPTVEGTEGKRGPEKRGVLLQYLDSHLEELRPYVAQSTES